MLLLQESVVGVDDAINLRDFTFLNKFLAYNIV